MNTDLTEIAFILDRSGSMQSCVEGAIAGFNEILAAHQNAPGQARLTLVLFDDLYETPISAVPVAEVTPLDTTTFVPRGTTALLDAIGRTIDELGAKLAATPEDNRPGKVIVAILTDGLENASRTFTWPDVAAKIRLQTDVYRWQFLFLGANQDAIATAARMEIASRNAATIVGDSTGVYSGSRAVARKTTAMRSRTPSAKEVSDLQAPIQGLADEEDCIERNKE